MADEQNQPVIPTESEGRVEESLGDSVIASPDLVGTKQSPGDAEQKPRVKEKKGLFSRACKDCEKRKKESEEYKAGWQRALADYKNLQRETAERRGEWARMSEAQILEDFIPVYDNFKKAFAFSPLPEGGMEGGREPEGENQKGWENWKNGIGYIMKQFAEVLKSRGVEEIKTVGEKFDPKWHEAAGEEAAEGKEPGVILREVDGGYKMGDRVIKPAKVVVVK